MRSRGKGHGPLGHGPLFGKSSISLSALPKTLNRTSAALSSSANIKDFMAASSCQSKLVIARLGLSMGGNARKPEASIQSNPTHRPGSIAQGRQTYLASALLRSTSRSANLHSQTACLRAARNARSNPLLQPLSRSAWSRVFATARLWVCNRLCGVLQTGGWVYRNVRSLL